MPSHIYDTQPSSSQDHGSVPPSASSTPPIQAPPVTPPPVYALVTPGLHRCSAIGLEEALNEAWNSVHGLVVKERESQGSSLAGSVIRESSSARNSAAKQRPQHSNQSSTIDDSKAGQQSSPHSPGTLSPSIVVQSPLLSFLSALRLRTIIYLSPSLLPASLLKLARDLNLSLLQWDLEGGRVWRIRQGAEQSERDGLDAFAAVGADRKEDDLSGLDLSGMSKATLEIVLNIHCSGVLVCDPSGLSETSLVIGCLRRMMRWNFASVCLEYRSFAPSRSASTANHLRFIELFPLETLELPDWPNLVPWAARALRLVQKDLEESEAR